MPHPNRTGRKCAETEHDAAPSEQGISILKVLLTIDEFMAFYGAGRTTTYELLKSRRLEAVKVGRSTRIKRESADAWVASLPEYQPERAA